MTQKKVTLLVAGAFALCLFALLALAGGGGSTKNTQPATLGAPAATTCQCTGKDDCTCGKDCACKACK